jgi:3-hydroxymyristoyl/3-hydroxydecanoyl-(acyl carrier protein) dehydratase
VTSEPVILAERVEPPVAELVLTVPPDLRYFRGHFPGAPVLPGVVQLSWALKLANRFLGVAVDVRGIEALKFRQVIRPEARVTLTLTYAEKTGKLHFSYESDRGPHSSGRIALR